MHQYEAAVKKGTITAAVVATILATTASSAQADSVDDDLKPGDTVTALEAGDSIDMPDVAVRGSAPRDGDILIALDDYGNETRVVVNGDQLVALSATVATTPEGQAALREHGIKRPKLAEPMPIGIGPSARAAGCGSTLNWVAPAGGAYYKKTQNCGVIGTSRYTKRTYSWSVVDGGACAKALGHAAAFNGTYWYFRDYWKSGGCKTSPSGSNYITVNWGAVLDKPQIQFRSTSTFAGANGSWTM